MTAYDHAILFVINNIFMASWEKDGSGFWPTWHENKLFTELLAILIVYSTVWVGAQIQKTIREYSNVGYSELSAPTISVSASGKASVVPDIATTDVTVMKTATTAVDAQNAASSTMTTVLAAVKALGIADADLQTSSFSTSEVYDYDVSPAKVTGYQSSQTLTVKIRNTDLIASVLDAGPKNGATSVSSIRYEVDDETAAIAEARDEAIARAKVQAMSIATSVGGRLGRVVSYNESQGGSPMPYYGMFSESLKAADSIAPSIEVGTQEIEVTVSITYALK